MKTRTLRMGGRNRAIAGFTLLELLVVLVLIAVLFAIAAPSWEALLGRQRVGVVREQAVQAIRQVQNSARSSKVPKVLVFDPNPTGIPRFTVLNVQRDITTGQTSAAIVDPATLTNADWTPLGNGDVKNGSIEFSTTPAAANNQIVFDSNGFVDQVSLDRAGSDVARNAETATSRVFAVKVRQKNTSSKTNRCAIVKTILGAIDLGDGDRCENV